MSSITDIDRAQFGSITFAEPQPEHPYADIFSAAAQNELVAGTDNLVAEPAAREQAYDARIRAIKEQTGVDLENPERGGYSIEARKAIRAEVIAGGMSPIDEPGGIPAYQKRIFDQKVAELQQKHPDLTAGDINEEARNIAHTSGDVLARTMSQPELNPILKYGAEFAGSLYGERRNPLFLGSLFAGPTSAVGETVLARIASSALYQGLYNAGLTAAAQPAVQEWQAKIGRENGVVPALQDVGMAFVMGMIPGAAIEGVKELAGPLRRLMSGRPEAGDLAKAGEGLGPVQPPAAAAMRAGEESLAADGAALSGPVPKDVPAELHDDLIGAALKRADDPSAPSPEAVAVIRDLEQPRETIRGAAYTVEGKTYEAPNHVMAMDRAVEDLKLGGYDDLIDRQPGNGLLEKLAAHRASGDGFITSSGRLVTREEAKTIAEAADQGKAAGAGIKSEEMQLRIEQAAPQTPADAMRVADEALDDFGRRDGMAALRERMQEARAAQDEATETWRASEGRTQHAPANVLNKIPMVRRDGTVAMASERTVRAMGDIEAIAADVVRSCK